MKVTSTSRVELNDAKNILSTAAAKTAVSVTVELTTLTVTVPRTLKRRPVVQIHSIRTILQSIPTAMASVIKTKTA